MQTLLNKPTDIKTVKPYLNPSSTDVSALL